MKIKIPSFLKAAIKPALTVIAVAIVTKTPIRKALQDAAKQAVKDEMEKK